MDEEGVAGIRSAQDVGGRYGVELAGWRSWGRLEALPVLNRSSVFDFASDVFVANEAAAITRVVILSAAAPPAADTQHKKPER